LRLLLYQRLLLCRLLLNLLLLHLRCPLLLLLLLLLLHRLLLLLGGRRSCCSLICSRIGQRQLQLASDLNHLTVGQLQLQAGA
jgi:hypothetical protein